jgi:hypothetical protein
MIWINPCCDLKPQSLYTLPFTKTFFKGELLKEANSSRTLVLQASAYLRISRPKPAGNERRTTTRVRLNTWPPSAIRKSLREIIKNVPMAVNANRSSVQGCGWSENSMYVTRPCLWKLERTEWRATRDWHSLTSMKKLREVFEYGGVKPVISRHFQRLGVHWYIKILP